MASALPQFIAVAINTDKGERYVSRDESKGLVWGGSEGLLSPVVKIEVERAKKDSDHVHLRFTHSNRYWQKSETNSDIVAVSKEPDEEKKNPSCTLFKPGVEESDVLYLIHAQTGLPVVFDHSSGYLRIDRTGRAEPLRFVNAGTLVRLPKRVAFKAAYNGCFLKADIYRNYFLNAFTDIHVDYRYFRFNSSDRDEVGSRFEVFPKDDGHVMIRSEYYGLYWSNGSTWIEGGGGDSKNTHFWPVKISDNVIALRSAANGLYCRGLTANNKYDCLNANESYTSGYTHLEVQEQVRKRIIRNVRYRMEDARIYGGTPVLVKTVSKENYSDYEDSLASTVEFKEEISYTFSQGLSITTGVTYSMEAKLPFIDGKGGIEMHRETNKSLNWGHTKMEAVTVTASGTVVVPPRSRAKIQCFATKGTCNIPFSYTQEDHSSLGTDTYPYDMTDGIFEGVSFYNIEFEKVEDPIA